MKEEKNTYTIIWILFAFIIIYLCILLKLFNIVQSKDIFAFWGSIIGGGIGGILTLLGVAQTIKKQEEGEAFRRKNESFRRKKEIADEIPNKLEAISRVIDELDKLDRRFKEETNLFHHKFIKVLNCSDDDKNLQVYLNEFENYVRDGLYKGINENFKETKYKLFSLAAKIHSLTYKEIREFI